MNILKRFLKIFKKKRVLKQILFFGYKEWGNGIYQNGRTRFIGYRRKRIDEKETVIIKQSDEWEEKSEVFLVTKIEYMHEPDDQFFGEMKSIGFVPNELIKRGEDDEEFINYIQDLFNKQ